jgi:hypothetical protein
LLGFYTFLNDNFIFIVFSDFLNQFDFISLHRSSKHFL